MASCSTVKGDLMADIDGAVAEAVDRATEEYLSESQAREQLVRELGALAQGSYDRAHSDAILAAMCFRLLPDGTFCGDFAGAGPSPWPRSVTELSPEVLDLWTVYASHLRSAALRARLHDLLAAAGASQRHVHARAAISAYREAVTGYRVSAVRTRGQMRAVQSQPRSVEREQPCPG